MTADEFISMHKTYEDIIEKITLMSDSTTSVPSLVDAQLNELKQHIIALAVIQRDLLKSALTS